MSALLTNGDIAELLSREAERHTEQRQRALRRAARAALWRWDQEAGALREAGRPFTDLPLVGPWIAHLMDGWFDDGIEPPERPPLRSGFLTLSEARATLREHPDRREAYRGDLQVHTTWSDGSAPLATMAAAAARRGYEYVAITDHSKGLPIANGMPEERFREQWREMAEVGEPIAILRGIEMNLSLDGKGDMDDELLAELDVVVGAFHSKLRVRDDQTERYLAALDGRYLDVLAHPRGRRYDVRYGLVADWERVARRAAERDVALEIDAWPDRQDLDVGSLAAVAAAGGRVAIDTDAHAVGELAFVEFGLAAAIRAGISTERIVNFLPRDELLTWTRERRQIARRSWAGASG